MRYIMVPMWVVIVLIILAWVGVVYVFWFKPMIMPKVNNHFAQRRHLRRLRNYAKDDVMFTKMIFNAQQNTPPSSKKSKHANRFKAGKLFDISTTKIGGIPYASARHRR